MNNVNTLLNTVYSYEYFGPIIFGITAFLIVLFFIILFFGKKDEKKDELEATKQLELASLNAFADNEIAKDLAVDNTIEETKEKDDPFAKLNELVEKSKEEISEENSPKFVISEDTNNQTPGFEFQFDSEERDLSEEKVNDSFETSKTDNDIIEQQVEDEEKTLLSPILEPTIEDEIIIPSSEEPKVEESPVEVTEVQDKFSSLANSIEEELNNLESMIKESKTSNNVNSEEQPVKAKDIPGAKQVFSSVFVSPAKEEIPDEYNNEDFTNKFNSLLKDHSEKKAEEPKEEVEIPSVVEEKKNEEVENKPFNFKIKEVSLTKSIDLPKIADIDLPKFNGEGKNDKITKDDFPEFPSLSNELDSYKR